MDDEHLLKDGVLIQRAVRLIIVLHFLILGDRTGPLGRRALRGRAFWLRAARVHGDLHARARVPGGGLHRLGCRDRRGAHGGGHLRHVERGPWQVGWLGRGGARGCPGTPGLRHRLLWVRGRGRSVGGAGHQLAAERLTLEIRVMWTAHALLAEP